MDDFFWYITNDNDQAWQKTNKTNRITRSMVARTGLLATICWSARQARKGAAEWDIAQYPYFDIQG